MNKPVIGIIDWPYMDIDGDSVYCTPKEISDVVIKNGGIPYIIVPVQWDVDYANTRRIDTPKLTVEEKELLFYQLSLCDAIIKPGGTKTYEYENMIYEYAYEHDVPYLGICAGMQVMAHHGYQNEKYIPNIKIENSSIVHRKSKEEACETGECIHDIMIYPGTLLSEIYGGKKLAKVNSYHSVKVPEIMIHKVSARSNDGVIEAIEAPDKRFHLGVQFHPEKWYQKDPYSEEIFKRLVYEGNQKRLEKKKEIRL